MRIALGVEYNGSRYCGWQRQHHSASVQESVERALSKVAAQAVTVHCAGRTDTGVHGLQQVVHIDTDAQRPEKAWVMGGNSNLPDDIALRWARPVDERFHARYSAVARSYRYVMLNRRQRPGLLNGRVAWIHQPLAAETMHVAAQQLLGEHDFSSFRAAGCQARHPTRELHAISVLRDGDLLYLDLTANAFLHNMVRIIAGSLIAVGCGERPIEWVAELLASRDRTLGGITAPPGGLYFVGPRYPVEFGIPELPALPRF